ncbi:MAG: O-succinylbenzoate synthase [Marinilabiliales bacterium]|nr:MAG: O-succinylbenzoate synthase [Marinilabiliales bacterium]
MYKASFTKHTLKFKIPGGTSRGILKTKDSWYLEIWEEEKPTIKGIGEASIIKNLSIDDRVDFEEKLIWCINNINSYSNWNRDELQEFPAIKFALEMAFMDLHNGGNNVIFDTEFTKGRKGIFINGLIWMGSYEFMRDQIIDKIDSGFRCIKIKIGAINFEEELSLLKMIREEFDEDQLELRLDANGAFSPSEVLEKLKILAPLGIHSIEQPIKQKQWVEMANLCKLTPIPIALDEELIGLKPEEVQKMLDTINPQYIILKPSLLGGFEASKKIITLAEERNINWWVTSALEANIGLNAIAQWTYTLKNPLPQGLGTGKVFSNNIKSPLEINNAKLYYNPQKKWSKIKKYNINGQNFDKYELIEYSKLKLNDIPTQDWEKQIFSFILEWFNENDTIKVLTSGSTGKAKPIFLKKKHMEYSAKNTINLINLKKGDKALLCLPAEYIAGKMMIVRSLTCDLQLDYTKPGLNPMWKGNYQFAAFTPSMISKIIEIKGTNKLEEIDNIILGGSSVSVQLEKELSHLSNNIFHTYGMTETITHIALRKISTNNKSDYFTPFSEVKLSTNKNSQLIIDYPKIGVNKMITNDIVKFDEHNNFKILGRTDNIIISGALKINPELIERELSKLIKEDFFVFGIPETTLGNKLVVFVQGKPNFNIIEVQNFLGGKIKKQFLPKEIFYIDSFDKTLSGKTIRKNYLKNID